MDTLGTFNLRCLNSCLHCDFRLLWSNFHCYVWYLSLYFLRETGSLIWNVVYVTSGHPAAVNAFGTLHKGVFYIFFSRKQFLIYFYTFGGSERVWHVAHGCVINNFFPENNCYGRCFDLFVSIWTEHKEFLWFLAEFKIIWSNMKCGVSDKRSSGGSESVWHVAQGWV